MKFDPLLHGWFLPIQKRNSAGHDLMLFVVYLKDLLTDIFIKPVKVFYNREQLFSHSAISSQKMIKTSKDQSNT